MSGEKIFTSPHLKMLTESVPEAIDNLTVVIDLLQVQISELQSDFDMKNAKASKKFVELCITSHGKDHMLCRMCQQASVSMLPLNLHIPPASALGEEAASMPPSASSHISNVSSASSNLHFGSLMIDSPTTHPTSLPLTGPSGSGLGSECTQMQGMSLHIAHLYNCLRGPECLPSATGKMVWSGSVQGAAASRPPLRAHSVAGSHTASCTHS
jgi:hypothetical protein